MGEISGLKRLNQQHLYMLELALGGMSNREIAQACNRTDASVSLVISSPLFQAELARRRGVQQARTDTVLVSTLDKARRIVDNSAEMAAEVMRNMLDSPDDRVKLASAKDLLDRTYGKGAAGQAGVQNITHISAERVQLLVQTMQESRALASPVSASSQPTTQSENGTAECATTEAA